jgi:hypothetical protein
MGEGPTQRCSRPPVWPGEDIAEQGQHHRDEQRQGVAQQERDVLRELADEDVPGATVQGGLHESA